MSCLNQLNATGVSLYMHLSKIIRELFTSETETCVPVHETRQEAKSKMPYKMH